LEVEGRLTRPKHWLDFIPFAMAHLPLKMTIPEAHAEVKYGWANAYSPQAIAQAVNALSHKPIGYRINILVARLCFRGIYFPQMGPLAWFKVLAENRKTILGVIKDGFGEWWGSSARNRVRPATTDSYGD